MPSPIRHACRFLTGNDRIATYLGEIERNAQLLRDIRKYLPPPLDMHCLFATLDAGILTLITDSPVWSSRLRFFAPELARDLRSRYGTIVSHRFRIQPQTVAPKPHSGDERRHKLSLRTANHLNEAAAAIEDPELAAALRRLAKAGR